jgi:hypothetical protein
VPLCRGHHREAHHSGDEAGWWKNVGVEPTATARALWLETHPLPSIAVTGGAQASLGTKKSKADLPVGRGAPKSQNEPK